MYGDKSPKKQNFNNVTRREFLEDCTLCATGIAAMSVLGTSSVFASENINNNVRAKVKLIFAHPDPEQPNWPNIGYDFKGHIAKVQADLYKKCPYIDFLPVTVASGSAETAQSILKENIDVDGYVIYLAGCLWGNLTETIAASGKPTVIVDHLFAGSGEFLTSYARALRAGNKVVAVSSSNFDDVVEAVKCFDCIKKIQNSTVLVVGREADEQIEKTYGTHVKSISFEEINNLYGKVNTSAAKDQADRWIQNAEKVIEPKRQDVDKAAAMYLTMLELLKNYQAQAITINCLGGIYGGKMVKAYPCLGFMQLDNDGMVGACEADQRSTMTKLIMSSLLGRPGFISDPVIDTAKNQIIYAHCVAPTKVYGPQGSANPYHLRSHSESREGVCNRSLMPLGEMTTTILFDHNKRQIIFHQGKSVENIDEDRACRNKLAVEVKGDIYKLLTYWDEWGWHRVTFYGDLKRPVYNLASLLDFKVVEEA